MSLRWDSIIFIFRSGCKTLTPFPHFKHHLSFSTSNSINPSLETPFIVDYLINSCGFPTEKAISLSTNLIRIKSPQKPDFVLSFLRNSGLTDTHIRRAISRRPSILSASVEKTLLPKVRILQELGMSDSRIADVLASNPMLLCGRLEHCIDFLKPLLRSKQDMFNVLKRSQRLVTASDIESRLQPNISLLRSCGASNRAIAMQLAKNPRFFFRSPTQLKEIIYRVQEMGVVRQNGMFVYAVYAVGSMSKSALAARFDLFKSFGWSEVDILSAFARAPDYLHYSTRKIRQAMDYFTRELGCDHSYIVLFPKLLSYSLEKRIIPRFNVLQILVSKELLHKNPNLYSVVSLSEKNFLARYVRPHEVKIPEICKTYQGYIS